MNIHASSNQSSNPYMRSSRAFFTNDKLTKESIDAQWPLMYGSDKHRASSKIDNEEAQQQSVLKEHKLSSEEPEKLVGGQQEFFEASNGQLELTYSRSEFPAQGGQCIASLRDQVSKDSANASTMLGHGYSPDPRYQGSYDKGETRDGQSCDNKLDGQDISSSPKKIGAKNTNTNHHELDPLGIKRVQSEFQRDVPEKASNHEKSKREINSGQHSQRPMSKQRDKEDQRKISAFNSSKHSEIANSHSQGKQIRYNKSTVQESGSKDANRDPNMALTFEKRGDVTSAMSSLNLRTQVTGKSQTSPHKGENNFKNNHCAYDGLNRKMGMTQKSQSKVMMGHGNLSQGKISAQAIYEKLGRGPGFDFKKISNPIRAFEPKAEIRSTNNRAQTQGLQEYVKVVQLGDKDGDDLSERKYTRSGYKGATSSTERPTAGSSVQIEDFDSQVHRENGTSHLIIKHPSETLMLHKRDRSIGYHDGRSGAGKRHKSGHSDVNYNVHTFAAGNNSRSSCKNQPADANLMRSSLCTSSPGSPEKTVSPTKGEEMSPLSTRRQIKKLLKEDISNVSTVDPRAIFLTGLAAEVGRPSGDVRTC